MLGPVSFTVFEITLITSCALKVTKDYIYISGSVGDTVMNTKI